MQNKRSLEWTDALETGDVAMNTHIHGLLQKANVFITAMASKYKETALDQILNVLSDYSRDHFQMQEALMDHSNYPSAQDHKLEHRQFIRALARLYKKELCLKKYLMPDDDDYDPRGIEGVMQDTYEFILDWYDNHMLIADKRLIQYLKYEK